MLFEVCFSIFLGNRLVRVSARVTETIF